MSSIDDRTVAEFADQAVVTEEATERLKKRLANDRQPGTAASTGSWVEWGIESDYLGQPWDNRKIPLSRLEQMRTDPILAFALMFVKVPLIRAPWYIRSADPRVAAAVDASLRKIYGRFVLAYTNSFDYGYSPMLKRFEYERKPEWTFVPKDDALAEEQAVWTDKDVSPLVWKPFTALNPRKARPHWNSKGEFNGIDLQAPGGGSPFWNSGFPVDFKTNVSSPFESNKRQADIPLDWALWATNEKDKWFDNYYGYPRIGYAHRFWWDYWFKFGIAARAFEKWGDPPMIIHYPDDPSGEDLGPHALGLVEQTRSGANLALPSTLVESADGDRLANLREWAVEQLEVKTDFSSIIELFEYLDVQKLRAVLVPEQALVEGKGGTSSRNVASTFGDLFSESQAVVKAEIDDHINRWVIPQFVDLNFGADAAKAEIVTTGFDPMDIETMQEIVRLIGQRKSLSMVDERELLERMGVPTVSRREANQRMEAAAAEAEAAAPPPVEDQTGMSEHAGVDEQGRYYEQRERIELHNPNPRPYLIEQVAELPNAAGVTALYVPADRTLYVTPDADPADVKAYFLGVVGQAVTKEGDAMPDEGAMKMVLSEIQNLDKRLGDFLGRDTNVQVELKPEPRPKRRVEFKRGPDGLIKSIEEQEVEHGEEE